MPSIRILALFLFVIAYVQGDLYMHNPRFVVYRIHKFYKVLNT